MLTSQLLINDGTIRQEIISNMSENSVGRNGHLQKCGACLRGGQGPQVSEVTRSSGLTHLSTYALILV